MTIKYYLTLVKMLFVLFVLIGFMQLDVSITNYKYLLARKEKQLTQEKTKNRYRIDQVSKVAQNIAIQYPAIGRAMDDVLHDLKEGNMYKIDQKIADLPEEMQSMIIEKKITNYGLKHYTMFDKDYDFPVNQNTGYVPDIYGEFGWRPRVFDEETYEYIYKESIKNKDWVIHGANDIVSPEDPRVLASNKGTIKKIGTDKSGGRYIVIYHQEKGKKLRRTKYFHLSEIYVEKGQEVKKGEVIGLIGNTGCSTGSHLDFKVQEWDGKRWVYINAFIGTTHNRKWMRGYYWYKKIDENGEIKWKVNILK